MAKLFITEFRQVQLIAGLTNPIPDVTNAIDQTVSIGASSAQSAALNSATTVVRVHTDSVCSIVFGASPTATTSNMRMAAGESALFAVRPGSKIAVIANT